LIRPASKTSSIGPNPLSFVFQYNPEMLTNTFSSPKYEEAITQENKQSAADRIIELINLNLELDATDQLEQPNLREEIVAYGLHPSLATLESILLAQNSKSSIVLFTWGPNRSIPVSIENVKIFEMAFDTKLNPIRAKIELTMRVLDLSDFRKGSRGYALCLLHSDRRSFFIKKRGNGNTPSVSFAKKIVPRHGWNDIVLPIERKEQLREICNYAKNYAKTFDKHTRRKGLNILFSGPSGTGKTLAAEIIASALKYDVYKIDLSMVVSKYIGETEKNLNKIFKDAEDLNAVLFFEEADALFGKRSEVKDSHDRYANIEVNYLLQKMEENEVIVILATNTSEKIDEAFVRRMNFIVDFSSPNRD